MFLLIQEQIIVNLKKLLDQGILSEQEFNQEKVKILSNP